MTVQTETYENRRSEIVTIEKIENGVITTNIGWSTCPAKDVVEQMHVGMDILCETVHYSQVVGWMLSNGTWLMRKSDQQLEAEHKEFVSKMHQEHVDSLNTNRADWQKREEDLPQWARERLAFFHVKGGENFAVNGWGYELCVAELAVLYDESNNEESEMVKAYSILHGTSGNQHECAKWLARHHKSGQSLSGTISALSPLTGDAFWEKDD